LNGSCKIAPVLCGDKNNKSDKKANGGCTFNAIDCSTFSASNLCQQIVKDPTDPLCCVEKPKDCNLGDPCKTYTCDPSDGTCKAQDKCVPATCKTVACGVTGCIYTDKVCTPPNGCFQSSCDVSNGECVFIDKCDDNDACTEDSCVNGACQNVPMVCTDTDPCTINTCVNGACSTTADDCNDGIECTKDSCGANGCSNIPDDTICETPDPCTNWKCDAIKGCVSTNVTCPATDKLCIVPTCISYAGCTNQSLVCPSLNKTCSFTRCLEDRSKKNDPLYPCTEEKIECGAAILDSTVIAVASVLSAGVIAAIIAAVVLFGGLATGATLAIYQRTGDDSVANVSNNPLFIESGSSGTNPLSRV